VPAIVSGSVGVCGLRLRQVDPFLASMKSLLSRDEPANQSSRTMGPGRHDRMPSLVEAGKQRAVPRMRCDQTAKS